jgi:hypothetical protein
MYEKDVMNRAPTPLSHKAQPYFSGGHAHNVLDTWESFSILHKYCSEKEEWAGLTWQLWATLSDCDSHIKTSYRYSLRLPSNGNQ